MEPEDNGVKSVDGRNPTMNLVWIAGLQTVEIKFNPQEFKTWEFVVGFLEMAKEKAKVMQAQAQMMHMQQQALQAQQAQQSLGKLVRGR